MDIASVSGGELCGRIVFYRLIRGENCADVSYFIVILGGRIVRTYRILSSYWLVPKFVLLMYVVTITDGYRHERSQYRLSDTLNSAC